MALIDRTFREKIVLVGVTIPPVTMDDRRRQPGRAGPAHRHGRRRRHGPRRSSGGTRPTRPSMSGRARPRSCTRSAWRSTPTPWCSTTSSRPAQSRNLEKILGRTAIDRTAVILDIFAQNARTQDGKAQVELAQLRYRLPRLRGRVAAVPAGRWASAPGDPARRSSRSTGAGCCAGSPSRARSAPTCAAPARTQRKARRRCRLATVALVGYTNAGKSTLLNRLTDAGVLVEDRLFSTLDPTTRRLDASRRRDRAAGRHGRVRAQAAPPAGRGVPLDAGGGRRSRSAPARGRRRRRRPRGADRGCPRRPGRDLRPDRCPSCWCSTRRDADPAAPPSRPRHPDRSPSRPAPARGSTSCSPPWPTGSVAQPAGRARVPYDRGDVLAALHRAGEVLTETHEDDAARRAGPPRPGRRRPLRRVRRRAGPERTGVVAAPRIPTTGWPRRARSAAAFPGGLVDLSIGAPSDPPPRRVVAALSLVRGGAPGLSARRSGSPASALRAAGWMQRRFGVDVPTRRRSAPASAPRSSSPGCRLAEAAPTRPRHGPVPRRVLPDLRHGRPARRAAGPSPSRWTGSGAPTCRPIVPTTRTGPSACGSTRRATRPAGSTIWTRRRRGGGPTTCLVLSDECYAEFTWDGPARTILTSGDPAGWWPSTRCRSAPTWPGCGPGSTPATPSRWRSCSRSQARRIMIPGPVPAAAAVALGDQDHVDVQRERYRERLARPQSVLGLAGVEAPLPGGGFYLWAPAPGGDDWGLVERLATEAGCWGRRASSTARPAVGTCAWPPSLRWTVSTWSRPASAAEDGRSRLRTVGPASALISARRFGRAGFRVFQAVPLPRKCRPPPAAGPTGTGVASDSAAIWRRRATASLDRPAVDVTSGAPTRLACTATSPRSTASRRSRIAPQAVLDDDSPAVLDDELALLQAHQPLGQEPDDGR